jgi:hypothetical protein
VSYTWFGGSCLAFVVLAACSADHTDRELLEAPDFREWDSLSVRVVESSKRALGTHLPWVVDTVPDLTLGHSDGGVHSQFQDIAGIVGLSDGALVVLDAGGRELRWFEASGEHLRTTGGPGQGPGEFLDPRLVPRFQTDSLLIFDRARGSFTWVSIDGSGARAHGPGGELFIGTPIASAGSRALFVSSSGQTSCTENQPCDLPLLLRWVDMTGTVADTLAVHTRRFLIAAESGRRSFLTGPLDQRGLAAAGPDGLVLEGGPRFELRQFDAAGRLTGIFRVDAPPRGDPRDALDRYLQRFPDPDEVRGIFELMLPEVLPAFQALRVDALGWYWAELFRPSDEGTPEWLVFDPAGRARGLIELPRGLEVHEIGQDYILGRWTGELGVEHVRRHALDRRGT